MTHATTFGAILAATLLPLGAASEASAICRGDVPCVVILDTGIDPTHPDLAASSGLHFRDFTNPNNVDAIDDVGHGTAVASRVAGAGACSAGPVPEAEIFAGKVNALDDPEAVSLAAVVAGIDWAIEVGADAVNLSLGGVDLPSGTFGFLDGDLVVGKNSVEQAVSRAADAGLVVVIAVGNTTVATSEINTPSNALEALVVGATAADGTPKALPLYANSQEVGIDTRRNASFSDLNPHVVAIGSAELVMARAAGTLLGPAVANRPCVRAAGTSFSTPYVAGVVAGLRHAYTGDLEGAALVEYLIRVVQRTAIDGPFPYAFEGYGFVETGAVRAAAQAHVAAGTLPPARQPNESFRALSDELRRLY